MIAYLWHSARYWIAVQRVHYWSIVCAGQHRIWRWSEDDDKLVNALIDRADALRKKEGVWK